MKAYLLFIKYGSLLLLACVALSFLYLLIFGGGTIGAAFGIIILTVATIYIGPVLLFSKLLLKSKSPNVLLVIILSLWILSPLLILVDPVSFFNAILPTIDMK